MIISDKGDIFSAYKLDEKIQSNNKKTNFKGIKISNHNQDLLIASNNTLSKIQIFNIQNKKILYEKNRKSSQEIVRSCLCLVDEQNTIAFNGGNSYIYLWNYIENSIKVIFFLLML